MSSLVTRMLSWRFTGSQVDRKLFLVLPIRPLDCGMRGRVQEYADWHPIQELSTAVPWLEMRQISSQADLMIARQ